MQDPEGYWHANAMPYRDITETLNDHPVTWKKTNARLIDIGCGDGRATVEVWMKYIPSSFSNIVGSDKSQACVDFAKGKYENELVTFLTLDIEKNLPNELKECFDHVVSSYALNWVQQQEKAFSNIYDLLAKDGNCLLLILGNVDVYENYRKLSRIPKWSVALKDVETRFMSPYHDSEDPGRDIRNLMKKIGFRDINVLVKNKTHKFANGGDGFKKLNKSTNVFEGLKDKWEDFMDDFAKLKPDLGTVVYQLLVVSGTK